MLDRLSQIKKRYLELEQQLNSPEIFAKQEEMKKLLAERKTLLPIARKYDEYMVLTEESEKAEQLATDTTEDAELRSLAKEELISLKECREAKLNEIKQLLIPRNPDDDRNVVMEIRAGTGGEEAALFAADLYRMYRMYAEMHRFSCEPVDANETELGGYKEITFLMEGKDAYSRMKYESGVHRVQRVPETESQGRIQTSAVTVAVLPEAGEVEVEILPSDIKMESCKSSGAGGQHINKTESAVRITHLPTGIVVECQEERSQFKNREKAMKLLRSKLYQMKRQEQDNAIANTRKSQVGSGDRSEKIRTYHFPQSRVTDHRISLTLYSLRAFLDGDMDEMIDALTAAETAEKLKGQDNDI